MHFIKTESLGNDFILLDARDTAETLNLTKEKILELCDRHRGIGADGILLLTTAASNSVTLTIFNADGSKAAMCGNGLRCVAAYLYAKEKLKKTTVVTEAGVLETQLISDNQLVVEMPEAEILADDLKTVLPPTAIPEFEAIDKIYHVNVGVPHVVVLLKPQTELNSDLAVTLGGFWMQHPLFPHGTNLDLVVPANSKLLKVLTYERGVGLTAACGTGATAVAAAWLLTHPELSSVTISFRLGDFIISKSNSSKRLKFAGPLPKLIFRGELL